MIKPLRISPLTQQNAEEICAWRYPVPYHIFNWPDWTEMVSRGQEFGDPDIREQQYVSIVDSLDRLVGFAQLFPMAGVTRLGFGMRPDLCGQGHGLAFILSIVQEARRRTPENEIDLEVLTWNRRAIKAYEKAGFAITDTYDRMTPDGLKEFHCMTYMEFVSRD